MPPIKDPMTDPTKTPVLLLDWGNGDGVLDFVLGCDVGIGDVEGTGGKGSKDVVQVYSSLLLISSNSISSSIPCVYSLPFNINLNKLNKI